MIRAIPPFFLLGILSSCATAFHEPDDILLISADPPSELAGVSVSRDGQPQPIRSLAIEEINTQAFGRYRLTQNKDPYTSGPGLAAVTIERSMFIGDSRIEIHKAGYKPQTFTLTRQISWLYALNIFNGIGFVIDLYSGFLWDYTPQIVSLDLMREGD